MEGEAVPGEGWGKGYGSTVGGGEKMTRLAHCLKCPSLLPNAQGEERNVRVGKGRREVLVGSRRWGSSSRGREGEYGRIWHATQQEGRRGKW